MARVLRRSLAVVLLLCGVIAQIGLGPSATAQPAPSADAAPGAADLNGAVGAAAGVPADGLIIKIVAQADPWAYGTAVVPAVGEGDEPKLRFFLATQTDTGWVAAIRFTDAFDQMLAEAPASFPTPEIRASLAPIGAFTAAGDGSSQLSLPFPAGETWYFQGAHGHNGIYDALDFAPKPFDTTYDATGGKVLAMRGGIAYKPCADLVTIDHGDGWTTGYYHISGVTVTDGQVVSRGTQVGVTDDLHTCGGYASTAHVHVSIEYRGEVTSINGHSIGGWTVEQGPDVYLGCLVRGNDRRCRDSDEDWNNYITNDGQIGNGGTATLDLTQYAGTVGDAIGYTINDYPASAPVTISWRRPGGSTASLGTVTTNASGDATGQITVPATTIGSENALRFTSGTAERSVKVEVYPWASVTPGSADPGDTVAFSVSGFAKQASVTLTHTDEQTGTETPLGTLTTNNTGGGSKSIVLPAGLATGNGQISASVGGAHMAGAQLRIVSGPSIWSNAMVVRAGGLLELGFANFPAGQAVTVTVEKPDNGVSVGQIGTYSADGNGIGSGSGTVPSVPGGLWRLRATSGNVAATTDLSIGPNLITPSTAQRGQSVTVAGKGFSANSTVTISWMTDQGSVALGTGVADANGSVSVSVTAPSVEDSTISLIGRDSQNTSVFAGLVIAGGPVAGQPSATLTPVRSTVNTKVAYSLSGFPASATVQIAWKRISGSLITLGTVQTDASGAASGQVTVPATPGGTGNGVRFTAGSSTVTAAFEVAPRIKVTPASVAVGATVDVSLRGFAKQEAVRIRWKKGNSWVQVAQVTTSNTGSANVDVTVPAWATNGTNSVRADGTTFSAQTNAVTVTGASTLLASEETSRAAGTPEASADATPVAPTDEATPADTESDATATPEPSPSPEPTETPAPVATPIAIVGNVSSDGSSAGWAAHDGDQTTYWQVLAPAPAPVSEAPAAEVPADEPAPMDEAAPVDGSVPADGAAPVEETAQVPAGPVLGPDGLPLPAASLVLDLGGWTTIGTVRWMFATDGGADDLRIEVSDDGLYWTPLTAPGQVGNAAPGTWQELPLAPGSIGGRYVRFAFENPNGDEVLGGLAEVEVLP